MVYWAIPLRESLAAAEVLQLGGNLTEEALLPMHNVSVAALQNALGEYPPHHCSRDVLKLLDERFDIIDAVIHHHLMSYNSHAESDKRVQIADNPTEVALPPPVTHHLIFLIHDYYRMVKRLCGEEGFQEWRDELEHRL